jgi:preprotein translocase subunit SecY
MQSREKHSRLFQAMKDMFALPELRRKLVFTFAILVIFRFLVHIPLPGVDTEALSKLFEQNELLGMLNLFSGGAMKNFSIAALGVYPYITTSIIMQLLVPVIPSLQRIAQEGEAGKRKINKITHMVMVPMAAIAGYGQLTLLRSQGVIEYLDPLSTLVVVVSLTTGTVLLVWLGELITERGIGNGISIIIFGGIVASLPDMIGRGFVAKEDPFGLIVFIILGLITLVAVVAFIEAHRRIPVQYARSSFRGGRMYRQSGSTYIPPSGQNTNLWNSIYNIFNSGASLPMGLVYWGLYFLLVLGFTFFYTMVIFEQMDLPKTLQQQGGFIPGVRPGKATAEYLNHVIKHLTFGGALFLGAIAVMPFFAREITGVTVLTISSTAILIAVGVALDTMKQLESQLTMRRYDGFLK